MSLKNFFLIKIIVCMFKDYTIEMTQLCRLRTHSTRGLQAQLIR